MYLWRSVIQIGWAKSGNFLNMEKESGEKKYQKRIKGDIPTSKKMVTANARRHLATLDIKSITRSRWQKHYLLKKQSNQSQNCTIFKIFQCAVTGLASLRLLDTALLNFLKI